MRFGQALVLSLLLHGLLLFATPPGARPAAPPLVLQATLLPPIAPQTPLPPPELVLAEDAPPAPPSAPQSKPSTTLPRPPPLNEQLAKELLYPPAAIAQGLEGEAWVLLIFDAQGRVSQASLEQSSGHALLDQAALRAVRRLRVPETTVSELILPVRFRLE